VSVTSTSLVSCKWETMQFGQTWNECRLLPCCLSVPEKESVVVGGTTVDGMGVGVVFRLHPDMAATISMNET